MPSLAAASTHLSETELSELDSLLRHRSTLQQILLRATIILRAGQFLL
ncbi:MAG: hypothetical protein HC812_17870 [Leptolyngbya sp. RL_3_1]|nr:hypothetical protein [Leptolyngbya sp. RL_3_1]